ncbi:MAG: histidinol dehydrogenase [Lachnospiraceae bacterium]|nr:histidinol dehydrogenase [Lachnospiraceae bacterium]
MKITVLNSENRTELIELLKSRNAGSTEKQSAIVAGIISRVRKDKDRAVFELEKELDHCDINPGNIRVSREEIDQAYSQVGPELVSAMRHAADNIRRFHEKQKENSWISVEDGVMLGQKVTPMQSSGCYVPGGRAAYPSSVLMNIIPAKVAGVERIIVCTPPQPDGSINPGTLAAADIAGADEIYRAGGAVAVAAMAYGTESIPKVDIITGPGNIYVALAKKQVFGDVGIDSVAGPSEILVIADKTADPRYAAADLLSQAEHDPMASAILLTTNAELAEAVVKEIDAFLETLSRREIIEASLQDYGHIFVSENMDDVIDAANAIASEHLEILTEQPLEVMSRIRNAGAIFMGPYSSEPLGDYFAGPNHILPTGGTARFFSPLGVDTFVKKSSLISYSKEALGRIHEEIELFAESEGLTAHANSIKVRFDR